MNPKAATMVPVVAANLIFATLFLLVYITLHLTRFVEYTHWSTVRFGLAAGAFALASGIFLRLRRRSILPSWLS
jgi:hypothetical protein